MVLFVGVDTHKRYSKVTVIDENDNKVLQTRISNTKEDIRDLFSRIGSNNKIAIEAGYNWMYMYELLEHYGEVVLVHPRKTRIIAEAKIKTDNLDSEWLAKLLRWDMVSKSYIPDKETRRLRDMCRHRITLVRLRTQIKNKVQSLLSKRGIFHEYSDLFGKAGMEFLRNLELSEIDKHILNNNLDILNVINKQIEEVEKEIANSAINDERAKLLMTRPGIDYFSAMLLVAEIGDINRFLSKHKLASWAGLVPSVRQSGHTIHYGHITKQGNKYVRWVLIQCANVAVRHDEHLREFYERIRKKKGHKIAIVATARKMLVEIYGMLKNNREYFYMEKESYNKKLKRAKRIANK